ncbi:Protein HOMOLOG OF MAMMALIAN LYST-INTERACTING PROTEIN 5 [Linum grandiflorum]
MASDNEPAKLLLPYLQRADELQKHEPLVAYYCRLYAMERGLKIPQSDRTKTTNSLLISLMKQLEKDKKTVNLGPEDNYYLEGFAQNVFSKADKQDRAGRADLSTAKTFYAASIFFEIINQFGPLQSEMLSDIYAASALLQLEQKQKYAVWKAADIRKALKEGRTPKPGPPVDDEDVTDPSSEFMNGHDIGTGGTSAMQSDSNPSSQFHDQVSSHHSADMTQSSQFHDQFNNQDPSQFIPPPYNSIDRQHSTQVPPQPPQSYDSVNSQHSPSPSPYAGAGGAYAHDFNPSAGNRSDNPTYIRPDSHHGSYSQEPQQHHVPQNYPAHDNPSFSYPNFQSYPSFADTSLPSVPSHYPSYYQGSDPATYSNSQSAPPAASYPAGLHHSSSNSSKMSADPLPTPAQTYQYDSNYHPPPDKIAEAHKAARFAVGALAFDEVSVAVEHLKKSLELLTNPSAAH